MTWEFEVEPRTNVITLISSEYMGVKLIFIPEYRSVCKGLQIINLAPVIVSMLYLSLKVSVGMEGCVNMFLTEDVTLHTGG